MILLFMLWPRCELGELFKATRSYAALRAADLDWIVGVTTDQGRGGRAGISKNVTHLHGVTTDLLDV